MNIGQFSNFVQCHPKHRHPQPNADWIQQHDIQVVKSDIFHRYQQALNTGKNPSKKNLGELATQEIMQDFVLQEPPCFLSFLEQNDWIASAYEIEQKAVQAGRAFSQLRYPP